MNHINWFAILVAGISAFILGGVWYSPALFGNTWMTENNLTMEKLKKGNMVKIYGIAFILSLIMAANLADVYRYILQNKARGLVLLKEEIIFLQDYFSLLKIRFEEAVLMNLNIPQESYEQYLIPPISLQILVENAIKHNEFSDQLPLQIDIDIRDEMLVVSNITRKKDLRKASSKIGLRNLTERYKLTTDKSISVTEYESRFTVYLPLLKID